MERVLIGGDLSKLNTTERLSYYKAVCESVGLNPLTKPFDYITLSGRLTLYAKKDATDQLRELKGISVTALEREVAEGIYVVTTHVKNAAGRTDIATGAVQIDHLKGEAKANAMMKAETKSKRRATLSICGLGMLDETEVESMPGARHLDSSPEPPTQALPPVGGRRANTGVELVPHVEKVADYYEVTDHDEVFEVRKDNGAVVCSCGADGKNPCQHRLAVKLWAVEQKAKEQKPAPADAEKLTPEEEQEALDDIEELSRYQADPKPITEEQYKSLCELTDQMEAAGIEKLTWTDQMENLTGSRSRRGLMSDDLAKVIFSFTQALTAQLRKGGKAKAK